MSEQVVNLKVSDALRDGYITPAMKGWATALCSQDAASFDAFLANTGPAYAHLFKTSHTAGKPPFTDATAVLEDTTEAAVCAQLGLPSGTLQS